MPTCKKCGIQYKQHEAEYKFEDVAEFSVPVSYKQLGKEFCGDCAIEEYRKGNYFETCATCQKSFYPEKEILVYKKEISQRHLDTDEVEFTGMYRHGPHCSKCAITHLLKEIRGETPPNIRDVALTWVLKNRDEDYTFGYTEEELEKAL